MIASEVLKSVKAEARLDISGKNPEVEVNPEFGSQLDLNKLDVNDKTWHEIDNVVAVFADLRGSSKLSSDNRKASVASIYTGSTGGLVSIFNSFEANYIQVQGDGVLAIFWGPKDYEKAICAAMTAKTFGTTIKSLIENRNNKSSFESGYRIGVSSSSVLVKKFGNERPSQQSLIWSGNAVNFAVKASDESLDGKLVITNSVWAGIKDNEYLSSSCECQNSYVARLLWSKINIRNIDESREKEGYERSSNWCEKCMDIFCDAIMRGDTERTDSCMTSLRSDDSYQNALNNPFRSRESHFAAFFK